MYRVYLIAFLFGVSLSTAANAWFIMFPLPNLAKPAPLNILIEALEKSEETKALAYVSEDKAFGSKYWVWGHFSGHVTQAEADRIALSRCETSLANAKTQKAGGKELYDFGKKTCELYSFVNKTVSPLATEQQRATPTTTTPPPAAAPASPVTPAPEQPATTPTPTPPSASAPDASVQSQPAPVEAAVKPAPQRGAGAVPASTSPAQNQSTKPQSNESATARKLRELNELRKEGLITEREYNEKRKAILSAM